jgi:hypothetical protein
MFAGAELRPSRPTSEGVVFKSEGTDPDTIASSVDFSKPLFDAHVQGFRLAWNRSHAE